MNDSRNYSKVDTKLQRRKIKNIVYQTILIGTSTYQNDLNQLL